MEDGEELTPFWLQSSTNTRPADRLRRGVSSVFFSSGVVVILLLVTAVFFLAFVVPSTLSFSAQIFRPNSVKRSWDSLNIVLVLAAVLFGFLSKIKKDDRYSYYDHEFRSSPNKQNQEQKSPKPSSSSDQWYNYNNLEVQKANSVSASSSQQWYESSDYQKELERKNSILRRNSSSYPDLREFSSNHWDHRSRFYDDFRIDSGRVSDPDPAQRHRRHRSVEEVDIHRAAAPQAKTIFVDTLSFSKEAKSSFSPPVLPEYEEKPKKRTYQRKERSNRKLKKDLESITAQKPPASVQSPLQQSLNPITNSPPPPPPPPTRKSSKSDSAAKDFFNSIYSKKNKKKQSQKSVENLNSLLHQAQPPLSFQIPPSPPPPPPPPPNFVFQNPFSSKQHKRKRTISVPFTPPITASIEPKNPNSQKSQLPTQNPPKIKSFNKFDEGSNSGGESPLNRMPLPPPPPPPGFFKNSAWKFVVQGDYVRIDSLTSSRSGSPDLDDVDSDVTPSAIDGETTPFHRSPLFHPSPDVNRKAESFITDFRAKLKMEKNHSITKREVGLSSLGPGSGPRQI